MTCQRCEALERRVAELSEVLEHGVFAVPSEIRTISTRLGVGMQQAMILAALWKSPIRMSSIEIDSACPSDKGNDRTVNTIRTQVFHIRTNLGRDFIDSRWDGYALSPRGRARMDDVMQRWKSAA